MTAVRPPAAPPGGGEALTGPSPRRVRPPRWLDLRLVLGVLLVLASVLVGARIVSAADATVPVWAVAGDLAAGTELTAEDLVAVDVRLDDAADAYLSTATRPEGRMLARAVREGELLPRTALEEADELRDWGAVSWSTSTPWPIPPRGPPRWLTAASRWWSGRHPSRRSPVARRVSSPRRRPRSRSWSR